MSYTLSGRLQTRLAAVLVPFLVACGLAAGLQEWWPLQLAGAMVAVGLAADVLLWHRLLPYQPTWVALPIGILELWATLLVARHFRIDVPGEAGLWFFAGSWLLAQLVAHALLPRLHLSFAEDGGELGRAGTALGTAAPVALAAVLGVAWVSQPPLVRLEAGVHQGPLVLDRSQRLVGEPGAVVRGGIVIAADDVTVRDVVVEGGEVGIEVRESDDVTLDGVVVRGARVDGINARQSSVAIKDCEVTAWPTGQGIEVSFGLHEDPSSIRRCTVHGGTEGIVTNATNVMVSDNVVTGTSLRGISLTEMSMGAVEDNVVTDALGIGVFCGDYSHCEIEDNRVEGTRPDPNGGRSRAGWDIVSHYYAHATVGGNTLGRGAASFVGASIDDD
jgi:parallel beta-helix repeat protein